MNPIGRAALVGALLVAVLGFPTAATGAQIYRWVDDGGVPHYSEGIDSIPERYRARAVPLALRNAPPPGPSETTDSQQAGAAAPKANVPKAGTVIQYTPGQRILVDVRINESASAVLLLDTGADRTLISPRALVAAGVSITRPVARGQVAGVTGSDQVDFVILDTLEVGEARVQRLPVMAYEMPQAEGDGLLGRDFLDQFNVAIDGSLGLVTLSPKQ